MATKLIHHAPKFNPTTKKWDVEVTDAGTGAHVRTKTGFETKAEGHEWSMQKAINNVVSNAAQTEQTHASDCPAQVKAGKPEQDDAKKSKKASGSSRLSL